MPHCASIGRRQEFQFVGLLTVWLLAGCVGYAACVFYAADAREVFALASNFSSYGSALNRTPAAVEKFERLRLSFGTTAGLLALVGAGWLYSLRRRGRVNAHFGRAEGPHAGRGLLKAWYALPPQQRRWALGGFAALTALRIVVSQLLITVDDSASYEFFVRKSLLTVSAYYPAPNNHVCSNTLSWLLYQVYPGYWWSMRVPVLLASTAGTAYWFLGLLRRSNFRVAVLALTLFSLLEINLFLAAEGRGYALLMGLSAVGFFSVLSLTDVGTSAPTRARAWTGLAIAGMVGLYTVPTFAYLLVAAYSWLGFCWLRSGYHYRLVSLGLLGAATLFGATLLYAPLLLVSGPRALLQNVYVKPLVVTAFFQALPAYLWELEGALMGESHNGVLASLHLGSLAAAAVVVGFLVLLRAALRGRLSGREAAYILPLGGPALWFLVLPYALLMMQRVQPPTRTLAFKAVFMFLLVGLECDWILHRFAWRSRHLRLAFLLSTSVWVSVQLAQLYRSNQLRLSYLRTPHRAAQWLVRQPPGPVLVPGAPWYLPAIQFYIHFEQPTSTLVLDDSPRQGVRYRYLIHSPAASLTPISVGLPRLHIERDVNCEAMDIVAYW
jgi:hypothetical protein